MKKLVSLMLCLFLLTGSFSAFAEATALPPDAADEEPVLMDPAAGYTFDFILRLHPEALSGRLAAQAQGYADLLEAIRFHGSYLWSLGENPCFELNLSIIPVDSRADPISLTLRGAEDLMFLESPLLGEKTITLHNYSLLNFCSKMSEHLGIPLHYLAMLLPYTWTFSLALPIQDWDYMINRMSEDGVISAEAVQFLWEGWAYRVDRDAPTKILVDALCKDSDAEESFRALVSEIPDYFVKTVAKEQEIKVTKKGDRTVWHAATGDFFSETQTANSWEASLNLPVMQTGYLPKLSLERSWDESRQWGRVTAQILGTEALQDDLVNLQASFLSFPTVWPADCQSLMSLSLTGSLLPNVGFSAYLAGETNGHTRLEIRKPTVNYEPGPVILTLEGDLNPIKEEQTIRAFTLDDLEGALDLLVANDAVILSFLPDIVSPMLEGLLHFLAGIPTSSCQTIMDDLTNLGVLDLLLSE